MDELPADSAAGSTSAAESASSPSTKPAFPSCPPMPTQAAVEGLYFDFNLGARVLMPARTEGKWRVELTDLDTGNRLFLHDNDGALIASSKRFYVRFGITVWEVPDKGEPRTVFVHEFNAQGREILIHFPIGTLGDTLGWFPYAVRFAERHGCRLTCSMSSAIIPLLAPKHPDIRFVTQEELAELDVMGSFYATYYLGLFFDDTTNIWQPTDFRMVGLHRTAGYILGVDPAEAPPRIAIADDTRPIAEKYAVIAVQSSSGCKYWNNPEGWHAVIAHLKALGLRVICIDQKRAHGQGIMWTHIPHGAEDETGDRPLAERARWLKHAEVFVGLSSGLAWLAWAAGVPVVLISGFTHPTNEFQTPYRVNNWHTCNSCWNDPALRFDHHNFLWCPRHANTERMFECTRLITAAAVIAAVDRVPQVAALTDYSKTR